MDRLRDGLGDKYRVTWESAPESYQTGLGILWRRKLVSGVRAIATERPTSNSRPRAMLAECSLRGVADPLLLGIIHWKSRLPNPPDSPFSDAEERQNSARWLADLLGEYNHTPLAALIGDFNAEPFEPPFLDLGLRAGRHFGTALWRPQLLSHLYNTSWRYLPEPAPWEAAQAEGFKEPRPKTSFGTTQKLIFDQLLVSGRLLKGGPLQLRETSVRFHLDEKTCSYTRYGRLRVEKWRPGTQPGTFVGASDHLPLLAAFRIVRDGGST